MVDYLEEAPEPERWIDQADRTPSYLSPDPYDEDPYDPDPYR